MNTLGEFALTSPDDIRQVVDFRDEVRKNVGLAARWLKAAAVSSLRSPDFQFWNYDLAEKRVQTREFPGSWSGSFATAVAIW